jgi:predicted 2-oxoglutarate/Fe(II)-dependent dioxygenase YbiX
MSKQEDEIIVIDDDDDEDNNEENDDDEENDEDEDEDLTLHERFESAFESVDSPGDFAIAGPISHSFGFPGIELKNDSGNIPIALPLIESQAKEIITIASKSPFGRKEETLFDDKVRNSWQLDPSQFTITNPDWPNILQSLLQEKVVSGLGVPHKIRCTLYKLLLYEKGGHFKAHRDTEKEDGMFGTMIVQLPCSYTGGEIIIEHSNRTHKFDLTENAKFMPYFAAFYADCQHQITEVTDGYRLCLIYNLVYTGSEEIQVRDQGAVIDRLKRICDKWDAEEDKLIYLLSHKYSNAGLSFKTLKGQDAVIAQVLKRMKQAGYLDLYLTLLTKTESGFGDSKYNIETTEVFYSTSNYVSTDEDQFDMNLKTNKSEIFPKDSRKNMQFGGEEIEEATGNEGATSSRWYKQAAIIFWPMKNEMKVWSKANPSSSVSKLEKMIEDNDPRSKDFCQQIMEKSSNSYSYSDRNIDDSTMKRLLNAILELDDISLVQNFISKVMQLNSFDGLDKFIVGLIAYADKYTWKELKQSINTLFKRMSLSRNVQKVTETVEQLQQKYTADDHTELLKHLLHVTLLSSVDRKKSYYYASSSQTDQLIIQLLNVAGKFNMINEITEFLTEYGAQNSLADSLAMIKSLRDISIEQCRIIAKSAAQSLINKPQTSSYGYTTPNAAQIIELLNMLTQLQLHQEKSITLNYLITIAEEIDAYKLLKQLIQENNNEYLDQCKKLAMLVQKKRLYNPHGYTQYYRQNTQSEAIQFLIILNKLQMKQTADEFIQIIAARSTAENLLMLDSMLQIPEFNSNLEQCRSLIIAICNKTITDKSLAKDMVQIIQYLIRLKVPQQLNLLVKYLLKLPRLNIMGYVTDLIIQLGKNGINVEGIADLKHLRDYCIAVIKQSSISDIEKLIGYNLKVNWGCTCHLCQDAKRGLNNPSSATYELRSKLQDRKHVESQVNAATNEVSFTTNTNSGSPHLLKCTKVLNKSKLKQRCEQEILQRQQRILEATSSTQRASTSTVRGPPPTTEGPPTKKIKP